MKLYELPRGVYFTITEEGPFAEVFYFDHVDGMYSVCYDTCGNILHFQAWTEVIQVGEPCERST